MRTLCLKALLLWLLLPVWAGAVERPSGIGAERGLSAWLKVHTELSMGVPAKGWPPYLYIDGRGGFSGPLIDFSQHLAQVLGVTVHFRPYLTFHLAQEAVTRGEVDLLFGFAGPAGKGAERLELGLLNIPRALLLRDGTPEPTQQQTAVMRVGCERASANCEALRGLGMGLVVEVDSDQEGVLLVKRQLLDAYVADLPTLRWYQHFTSSPLLVVTPAWLDPMHLSISIATREPMLKRAITWGMNQIPLDERKAIFEASPLGELGSAQAPYNVSFTRAQRDWLLDHGPLRFAIAPDWPSFSEIDKNGELRGYLSDLLRLIRQRTGLNFTLVPTRSWEESQRLLREGKVDFLPAMTPTPVRRRSILFTPDYASVKRVVVGRLGATELPSLDLLRGKRVGMVAASVEGEMLDAVGATTVLVPSDNQLLALLDAGRVDYVLMSISTLQDSIARGFNQRYVLVYSGEELNLPIAMGVLRQRELLQQILSKALLTVSREELTTLEKRWLSLTIQTGVNRERVLFWGGIAGGLFLLCSLIFFGWNRTLRRQISQRLEAEQRLAEQLAFVQMLLDTLPNLVVLTNAHHEITMSNRAYRNLFFGGRDLKGSYHHLLKDNLPEAIRERVMAEDTRVWESGIEINGHGEVQLQDGVEHEMLYTKRRLSGADGKQLGILTVLTDITDLRQAQRHAREMESRLTQLTDNVPGFVYQYHYLGCNVGEFLYASAGIEPLLGIRRDLLLKTSGFHQALELHGYAFDLDRFGPQLAHQVETEHRLDLVLPIMAPSGEELNFQVKGRVDPLPDGSFMLYVMVQDITALTRQALELQQARNTAERAMQARSRFLATMSHELRTPISGMHGMLELLQMSALDEDQRYLLHNVVASTNNLLYLVNDILDFSKIEAGQLHLDVQPSELCRMVCDVVRGHAAKAHGKGLAVELLWGEGVPDRADLDAIRVGQVLSNLLSNAVKFTERGSIRIAVEGDGALLRVTVSDSGIGIASEKQSLLFTPFEQVESDISRRYGGTGLGLAICHQLIAQMGGELTLVSAPGEGTSVTFTLPLSSPWSTPPSLQGRRWWVLGEASWHPLLTRQGAILQLVDRQQLGSLDDGFLLADEAELEAVLGARESERLRSRMQGGIILSPREAVRSRLDKQWWRLGTQPLYPDLLLESCQQLLAPSRSDVMAKRAPGRLVGRVLVADDHPINRALIARQLETLGVTATVVEEGEQALAAWQREPFDLLLTDCHMPVLDGYSLTRRLRQQGDERPIIGVTADTSGEAVAKMAYSGMSDSLFKPYTLETLWQMLSQWLPTTAVTGPTVTEDPQYAELADNWIRLFGDVATAGAMAQEFIASNRQDGRVIEEAVEHREAAPLIEAAHRVKGAARMAGYESLADEAARLESVARLRQWDRVAPLAQSVWQMMQQIENDIGLWLDEQ
ncbi:ATP-binding protein [Aeromonas schubertii]|uniref:ATP-binding protein n=1 Tax=Aeromonas schubertii TaxID=652 RepID=UPI001CC4C193|nr:transporter substrate-binding domain-containing protein [Aeromonas schubertii]MBZ6070819.1 transporter substrate-binding domain-containing protein [Aeromonas schubertii]